MAGALASPMHNENNVQQQPLVPRCSNVHPRPTPIPSYPIHNGQKGNPRLLLLPPLLIYRTSPSRPQSPAPRQSRCFERHKHRENVMDKAIADPRKHTQHTHSTCPALPFPLQTACPQENAERRTRVHRRSRVQQPTTAQPAASPPPNLPS
jgi:hypothetical protein